MRRILTLVCLLVITGNVWSQQEFVFIQSEANHPFYVRIGNSTYSSSAFGHIILAPLKDSSYQVFIGFARNEFPEQEFHIRLNRKDRGFDLRKRGAEEWNLVDWQNMQTIQAIPVKVRQDTSLLNEARRSDPFANLMAGLVNDSTVLYTSVKAEPKTSESTSNIKEPAVVLVPAKDAAAPKSTTKTDEKIAVKPGTKIDSPAIPDQKGDTLKASAPAISMVPVIKKIQQKTVGQDLQLKFLVQDSLVTDTVDILIEADTVTPDTTSVKKDLTSETATDNQTVAKNPVPDTAATKTLVLQNSDCREFATDQDVDKLRIQMMKFSTDDDRIGAAKKMFRQKCYTAKQVKALSELFPTDQGRYLFFDAAYPFVSDSGNFKSLVEMLSDPDYIDRFNKLVRGA